MPNPIDTGCRQLHRLAATRSAVKVSHLHSIHCASRRTHDLRRTHETWPVEDHVPRIMRLERLGHKRKDIDDLYSHVTDPMIEDTLTALQRRWEQDGGWSWASHADPEQDAA